MTGRYAEGTEVTVERSRAEIESTCRRYGAEGFVSGYDRTAGMVMFAFGGRRVRFTVPLPVAAEFGTDGAGRKRTADAQRSAADKEERRRWRALNLAIKAKLEVVETGIASFEEEFLAHIVLPDGSTFGDHAQKAVAAAYGTGELPALLPGGVGG